LTAGIAFDVAVDAKPTTCWTLAFRDARPARTPGSDRVDFVGIPTGFDCRRHLSRGYKLTAAELKTDLRLSGQAALARLRKLVEAGLFGSVRRPPRRRRVVRYSLMKSRTATDRARRSVPSQ